jgi:tRNA (guanine10-N2)-dimethyltransferase
MYIAILGRQPALGMAELEKLHGSANTKWFSDQSALIEAESFSIDHLGGSQKVGEVVLDLPGGDWHRVSMKIVQNYVRKWANFEGKITLGISAYGFDTPARDIQKTGIVLKQKLKQNNVSLRLIPNPEAALNSATSHHNKLGLSENKVEFIVVKNRSGKIVVAESRGAQNITAFALRDQERPKRDAFVGMLPPKLAQIMVNLARPAQPKGRVLDPFCGTGVVLQEASLMGYPVYGTDHSEKMIRYTRDNLNWLQDSHHVSVDWYLHEGDAMTTSWQSPVDAVVCESYLGQPFSAPPSPAKRDEVRKNCNHIIGTFLKNIGSQLPAGTPLCIAVPAWKDTNGTFTHLPLTHELEAHGYTQYPFKNITPQDLLYYREDQIVARELLVLVKS